MIARGLFDSFIHIIVDRKPSLNAATSRYRLDPDGISCRWATERGLKLGRLTPPKFNSSPLKNGGWKTILTYWEGNFSGAFAVKLGWCTFFSSFGGVWSTTYHPAGVFSTSKPLAIVTGANTGIGFYTAGQGRDLFYHNFRMEPWKKCQDSWTWIQKKKAPTFWVQR